MKNTRKRPICASKHNRWIDHPVTRFYDGEYHNLSAYFYYNENEDQVAMVIPVYEKKTDTLYYELSVIDPDTGKSRPIEKCSSSKEAMGVFDERKDYFINASTKTRKVGSSMRKRSRVTAGKFKSFRTFDVVSNGKVMKGFDADTFEDAARQVASWSEHCNKGNIITVADRKGNTRSFEVVRKGAVRDVTGDTLEERQRMGASTRVRCSKRFTVKASMPAKRRNAVGASHMMSVRCARSSGEVDNVAVRELVIYIINDAKLYPKVLSIINNLKRKAKKGQYDDKLAIKAWQYLADDGVRKYDKDFGSNNGSVSMLNTATRKEIAKQLRDYYKDQVFEDVEASMSVGCSRTMRKRPVKASTKRRFAINASVGDSVDVDEIKQILRDAGVNVWSVKKTRTHEGDLFEIVFDNSRDYSKASIALEDTGFDVKFDSSNGDNVFYFKINDNREAEAYLYRVVFEYNNVVVPMDYETGDYQAVLDACIDKMESEGKTGYLYTYDEAYDYAKDLADDEADVERIMEEEFIVGGNHDLYLLTAGNFNIIPIGFGKASEYVGSAVKCAISMCKSPARKSIKASLFDEDIVMYFNGKKIYTGQPGADMYDAILPLCQDDSTRLKFQEWCDQYGDSVFDEEYGDAGETAYTFCEYVYYAFVDGDDYLDGDGILNFEIFKASDEVKGAKSIKCSRSRRMRKSIKASVDDTISITYKRNVIYTGNPYDMYGALYRILFKDSAAKASCVDYLNSLGDSDLVDESDSPSEIASLLAKEIGYQIEDGYDVYENIGDFEIFTGKPVTSAKSIKCATITYNGNQYDADTVSQYYDMSVTNYGDLGAENEQEFFDKYIELDPDFVKLFDYDITPINSTQDIKCSTVTDMHGNAVNLVTM